MLNKAFAEEREFAEAYAPVARKKMAKPAAPAPAQSEPQGRKVEIFGEGTAEFAAALRRISPELLDLVRGQFNASPSALLRGAFQEEAAAAKAAAAEGPDTMSKELSGIDDSDDSDDE